MYNMTFLRRKRHRCIIVYSLLLGCILYGLFHDKAFIIQSTKVSLAPNDPEDGMFLLLPQRDESRNLDPLHTLTVQPYIRRTLIEANQSESKSSTEDKPQAPRVQVLIQSNRRSGTTFLGEIFNQNAHAFYQYEPLRLPEKLHKVNLYPKFLHRVMKCRFDEIMVKYWNLETKLRFNNKAMVEPPLCNLKKFTGFNTSHPLRKQICQPLQLSSLRNVCRSKQYLVNKLIRLDNISELKVLALDPEINLKIIHLVRDPRAIYISRAKVPSEQLLMKLGKKLDDDMDRLCRRIHNNLIFIRSQPAWIQGKYKLVRYEDLASHPAELAQDVYDFTGMGPLPSEVQEWIQTNTNHTSEIIKEFYYTTSRVSAQMPEAWRSEVPIEIVLRMQTFCRDTMRELGYLEVNSEEELLNKNKSLVVQLQRSK